MLDVLPLRTGASGDAVRDLQRRLDGAGYPCGADPDGAYEAATEAAVRAFQARRGLRADGVCGDQTWTSLVEAGYRLGDRLLSLRAPMLRGDDVADLQQCLGALGFDAGRVDGILGPATAAAIADFQRNAGLITDGICGPDTVAGLRLFASHLRGDGPRASTLASVRESEVLRAAPAQLVGRRIAIGDAGGASALAAAVARGLGTDGAVVEVVPHPDDEAQAAAANEFGAELYVGLVVTAEAGTTAAFYERDDFSSVGGRRLAELVLRELGLADVTTTSGPKGMRLPVLRATRMPAVVLEIGDPRTVVAGLAPIAAAIAAGISAWAHQPV